MPYGYGQGQSTPIELDQIFKYTDRVVLRSVTIDAVTEDASNADDPKYLRYGFMLGRITPAAATDPVKYREYTAALVAGLTIDDESKAVILVNNVQMDGVQDIMSSVAIEGDPYRSRLIFSAPADAATFDFDATNFNPEIAY